MPRQGEQQGHDPCCQTTVEVGIRQRRSFCYNLECTTRIIGEGQSDRSNTQHPVTPTTFDQSERTKSTMHDGFTQTRVPKLGCER